jgi:hypothetical protein
MQVPVLIEPLTDRPGYVARSGGPFGLTAEAATPDEAVRQLTDSLQRRLRAGARVTAITLPEMAPIAGSVCGWLPDDDLTRDWQAAVEDYRRECDARDRSRLSDFC